MRWFSQCYAGFCNNICLHIIFSLVCAPVLKHGVYTLSHPHRAKEGVLVLASCLAVVYLANSLQLAVGLHFCPRLQL